MNLQYLKTCCYPEAYQMQLKNDALQAHENFLGLPTALFLTITKYNINIDEFRLL